MNWDEYFIGEAYHVATKSKDLRTHVGAVIVGPDNEIRTTGYNSLPRGANDDLPERLIKPLKHFYFAHAERNAIDNAARIGVACKGCRMYVLWQPCVDCAKSIINSGIAEVVLHAEFPGNVDNSNSSFVESQSIAAELLAECGVKVRMWSGTLRPVVGFFGGLAFDPFS